MKLTLLLTTACLVLLSACNHRTEPKTQMQSDTWQLIYQTDAQGNITYGSKQDLIDKVRSGQPLRIGWMSRRRSDTTKSVEHHVNAQFSTIANGQEVFAQITPFMAQRPDLTSDTLSMTLMTSQLHWILGTNGTISSTNIDFVKDTAVSNPPSRFRYGLSWYAATVAQ